MSTEKHTEDKGIRKNVVLFSKDIEILEWFERAKGMDASNAIRYCLREMRRVDDEKELGRKNIVIPPSDVREQPVSRETVDSTEKSDKSTDSEEPAKPALTRQQERELVEYREAKKRRGAMTDEGWVDYEDLPIPDWAREYL